jgi:hypothetical protein
VKNFFPAAFLTGALLSAASFAQNAPSAQTPSAPPSQPEAQPTPNTSPQPAAPQSEQATGSTAAPTATNQPAGQHRIAPGSVIPVQLTKTIDAKKAKPGDEIVAKVTMDLKTTSGEVMIPKDTKVMGHVTEAQARNKEQKGSQVGIAFDRAVLKDGEMPLPMSIQAVIAPPSNNANNGSGVDQATPASSGAAAASPMGSGHSPAGAGATQPQPQSPPTGSTDAQSQSGPPPAINGNTQGVVGISNLKLEPAQGGTQGSVLSSEKNNVKVESGTMLLLRVNQ